MRKLLFTLILVMLIAAFLSCVLSSVAIAKEEASAQTEPAVASEETTQGGQENIFSGGFADALWTVIAFTLLLAVLTICAWKPILKGLKQRQDHIENEIKSAEGTRKQAEDILQDYKQRGHRIIEDATAAAQQSQRELIEETRKETQLIKTRAQDDVRHAMISASEHLWNEAADMMLLLGNEVLGRTITAEDNERLIREAIEKIKTSRINTAK
jgi:F-type H+-transporting ATPase subunit b